MSTDKLSKLAFCKPIKSKAAEDIKQPLRDIRFLFSVPKVVVIDNERSLNLNLITSMLEDGLNISIFKTSPYKSEINGQVKRFHSTLSEIMRCLKADGVERTFEELLERSINEYNHSIHSTTGNKPIELFFGRVPMRIPNTLNKFEAKI